MVARRTRAAGLVALAAVVTLVLAGCASGMTARSGAPGECDTSKGTLVVGLIAPLSGDLSSVGLGMKNSADLAVVEANDRCMVPGYHLALQSEDDRADPATASAAAQRLISDPSLVGVVGTFNSSTAQAVQPAFAGADIVQISPGNTNVSLTRGQNAVNAPLRQYQTYFRVVATDAKQGPAAADFLSPPPAKRRVSVVTDGKTYGEGLATEFGKQLETLGGRVVSQTVVPEGTPFDPAIAAIRQARPDAVFYGGEYPQGGPFSRALGQAGVTVPVIGGDGIVNPGYVTAGGREGDLGTSVGTPPESLPSAQQFLGDYTRAHYPQTFGAYGAFSFDAANVLFSAVTTALGRDGTWRPDLRPAVMTAVQRYSGDGATGPISFDRFGDILDETVTVYRVTGGRWTPLRSSD